MRLTFKIINNIQSIFIIIVDSSKNYNLSVSTYVEAENTREEIDIVKLNAEIESIVAREDALREAICSIIKEIEA